ncbi:MAG TPA: ATP-binding protein [Gammaproteobacteria bacterium]|nr:ATP-binding protein [Gammaproteobacteria bacterium]
MDVSTSLGINLEADAQRTLERVYERLPVMMYAANSAGRIVDVNTYWLKRLGYKKDQVLGRSSADFMPAGDSQERRAVWAQLMRGEEVTDWPMQYVSAAGEVVDGLLYGAPVLNAKLELQGAIATVFDVTELRAAERARDQLETELRLSQKLEAIGQLAAGIAHEINTPSQYVSDNLSFLQDAVTNLLPLLAAFQPLLELAAKSVEAKVAPLGAIDDYRALLKDADLEYIRSEIPLAIQQSRDGVAQIKKIVLAMKEFSHPGADEKEPVDLNRAVEATVMVARNEWKYVADVDLQLGESIPVIEAIPSAMNQVVLNLVVNAAHAIEDARGAGAAKGKITIATRRDGEFVELSIADTGCGIPQENVARIFDPFFTTKKVGKGTGQGLAIVRRVVIDRHGGTIDVQSKIGEGTRFRVRLPIEGRVGTLERLTA